MFQGLGFRVLQGLGFRVLQGCRVSGFRGLGCLEGQTANGTEIGKKQFRLKIPAWENHRFTHCK